MTTDELSCSTTLNVTGAVGSSLTDTKATTMDGTSTLLISAAA